MHPPGKIILTEPATGIILSTTGITGPYFALLPDTVPVSQRGFASGVMFLVGGAGMLSYLLFAARLWDTSRTRPLIWVVAAVFIFAAGRDG